MKYQFTSAVLFFLSSLCFAQSSGDSSPSPFPNIEKPARTYKFEFEARKGRQGEGTLKFIETKNFVQLEFEANGLKGGEYQILKASNCKTVSKSLNSRRSNAKDSEIFTFKTQYGDISSESKMEIHKLSELGLDERVIALIKVEKNKKTLVACTQ